MATLFGGEQGGGTSSLTAWSPMVLTGIIALVLNQDIPPYVSSTMS